MVATEDTFPPALSWNNVTIGYDKKSPEVLRDVSLHLPAGKIHGIIGPNGTGKSTLIKAALGLIPHSGSIEALGKNVRDLNNRDRAHLMAYVGQHWASDIDFTGRQFVELSRYARLSRFGSLTEADTHAVDQALALTGTRELAHKPVRTMSGGQQQLINLARAIAQESQILLLDEPTSALDISHVNAVLKLLHPWLNSSKEPRTVVAVLHDLELAARHCHTLTLVSNRGITAKGAPEDVLTAENIRASFGVNVDIGHHPRGWLTVTVL